MLDNVDEAFVLEAREEGGLPESVLYQVQLREVDTKIASVVSWPRTTLLIRKGHIEGESKIRKSNNSGVCGI